jgi:hypothetical protein
MHKEGLGCVKAWAGRRRVFPADAGWMKPRRSATGCETRECRRQFLTSNTARFLPIPDLFPNGLADGNLTERGGILKNPADVFRGIPLSVK